MADHQPKVAHRPEAVKTQPTPTLMDHEPATAETQPTSNDAGFAGLPVSHRTTDKARYAAVLALQRTRGNACVERLIAHGSPARRGAVADACATTPEVGGVRWQRARDTGGGLFLPGNDAALGATIRRQPPDENLEAAAAVDAEINETTRELEAANLLAEEIIGEAAGPNKRPPQANRVRPINEVVRDLRRVGGQRAQGLLSEIGRLRGRLGELHRQARDLRGIPPGRPRPTGDWRQRRRRPGLPPGDEFYKGGEGAKPEPTRTGPKVESKGPAASGEGAGTTATVHERPAGEPVAGSSKGEAAKGALEGGAQALLAQQLGNMRGAEAAKAEARYEQLRPEIERLTAQGKWVRVTLLVDYPDTVDIAGGIAGVGDPTQVVYFVAMWLNSGETKAHVGGDPGPGRTPPPKHDQLSQGNPEQEGDKGPRRSMHRVASGVTFAPTTGGKRVDTALPQKPGLLGTYRPVAIESVWQGEASLVAGYPMRRLLRIDGFDPLHVAMLDTADTEPYEVTYFAGDRTDLRGGFIKRREDNSPGYVILSKFHYRGGASVTLREVAFGEDKTPQFRIGSKWRAAIIWMKT